MKMIWKKYEDLTKEQKFLVSRMYTNPDPENYLYKYDENGSFKGRTPVSEIVENEELVSKHPVVEGKKVELTKSDKEFMLSKEVDEFHGKLEQAKKKSRAKKK